MSPMYVVVAPSSDVLTFTQRGEVAHFLTTGQGGKTRFYTREVAEHVMRNASNIPAGCRVVEVA